MTVFSSFSQITLFQFINIINLSQYITLSIFIFIFLIKLYIEIVILETPKCVLNYKWRYV